MMFLASMILPLAQSLSLSQWFNYWMNELSQYEPVLYFDWDTMIFLLEKEPLALTAVAIAFVNIVLTIIFKVSDYWKEAFRENLQRGRLHIEAYPLADADMSEPVLQIVLTNRGRDTLVIRDIGYQKRSLIKRIIHNVSPISIQPVYYPFDRSQCRTDLLDGSGNPVAWPVAIQGREFYEFRIQGELFELLKKPHNRFTVRDSLGSLWLYRGTSLQRIGDRLSSKIEKQLQRKTRKNEQKQEPSALEKDNLSGSKAKNPALFNPGEPVNLMLLNPDLLHSETKSHATIHDHSFTNPDQNSCEATVSTGESTGNSSCAEFETGVEKAAI